MSEQNLRTVQGMYEAFGRGDIPAIMGHVSESVRWEQWADNRAQKAGVPYLLPRSGKEGVLAFFAEAAKLKITEFSVLGLMAGGNKVVAEVLIAAEVPATGGRYRDEELHLWTFDDAGKVIGLRHYVDTAKHIEASAPRA